MKNLVEAMLTLLRKCVNFIRFLKGSCCQKVTDHHPGLSYRPGSSDPEKVSKYPQGNRAKVVKEPELQPNSPDFWLPLFLLHLLSSFLRYKEISFVTLFALTGFDLWCSGCFTLLHFKHFLFACFPSP